MSGSIPDLEKNNWKVCPYLRRVCGSLEHRLFLLPQKFHVGPGRETEGYGRPGWIREWVGNKRVETTTWRKPGCRGCSMDMPIIFPHSTPTTYMANSSCLRWPVHRKTRCKAKDNRCHLDLGRCPGGVCP